MMIEIKASKDKFIAVLIGGFLGHCLSKFVFDGILWEFFTSVLPPINDRHLSIDIYLGLIGALFGAISAYILFSLFVDKMSFSSHKRQYVISIIMLVVVPLILLGVFRYNAVSYVYSAENTIPTKVEIEEYWLVPEASIMFNQNSNSATVFPKHIVVEKDLLEEVGNQINNMKVGEVVDDGTKLSRFAKTIYIDYRVNDKWYSKILNYENGLFEESVANHRLVYYKNSELERLIQKSIKRAADIDIYNEATIYNHESMGDGKKLSKDEFSKLVSMLNNSTVEEPKRIENIKTAFKKGVSKGETHICVIELAQDETRDNNRNFMVYDDINKVLFYEGKYYDANLEWLL